MQPPFHPVLSTALLAVRGPLILSLVLALVLVVVGCRPPRPVDTPKPQPFVGVTIRLACHDPAFARELSGRGKIWGTRTGGAVVLESDWTKADAAVIPPARLGELANSDLLAGRPDALAHRDHQLRWGDVLPSFQDKLCNWGRRSVAVPVAGDGFVLLYRMDRFADPAVAAAYRAKYQRELIPPRTWEDLRAVAEVFHATDGKPSLPPLPTDPAAAVAAFHQIAACYDRQAVATERLNITAGTTPEPAVRSQVAFRFHVDPDNTKPRLTAPSFAAAFGWFHDTAKLRLAAGDPLDALVNGSAVAGVVSLADIAKLPKVAGGVVDPKFGIAPIPGSAVWFDAEGKPQPAAGGRNYVPCLGAGGELGVVFKRTTVADAAWDFLADLSGPAGADDTLGEVSLGAGPYRYSQVTEEAAGKWQRYGFDAARSDQLAKAVVAFAEVPVRDPVYPLRTPDQKNRVALLNDALRKAAGLTPAGALTGDKAAAEAQAAWLAADAKVPPAELLKWTRSAVGLE